MNKMNKKGFTIVELVIVIAVIAILAGVLIPTFGGVIEKANLSAELQSVTAAYKEAYAEVMSDGKLTAGDAGESCTKAGYTFKFVGTMSSFTCTVADADANDKIGVNSEYNYSFANGTWTVTKANNG